MKNVQIESVELERNTRETKIKMSVELGSDIGNGFHGRSGIGFFDHMLNSFAVHLGANISVEISGDIEVDCHHTIEDVGIVLGKLLQQIVQKRGNIARYGVSYIPMDEALARCVIDVSGRQYLMLEYEPKSPMIGDFDTQMVLEFFRAVASNMNSTLHISVLYGQNDHHMVEAIFKSFAHALKDALRPIDGEVLSAKGII